MNISSETKKIIYCRDCTHCFRSNRSKTGYACEMHGYDDFAEDTTLDAFCSKAKPLYDFQLRNETWRCVDSKSNV